MGKTVELCGRCAALVGQANKVRRVGGGADNKVTCQNCGRRRYGGTYEVGTLNATLLKKEEDASGDGE